MSLVHKIRSIEYLAGEFLTWLLWRTEVQEGAWPGADGRKGGGFELWPDDRLRLEAPIEGVTKNLLSGGTPSNSPEARSALAAGKLVQEARWKLIREDREWLFTLKAPDLDLRSVRLPELLTREDDERLRERVALMEQLERAVEDLYGRFLAVRLRAEWEREELPRIARWIAAGVE
jgi:hypothetical protein